MKLPFYVGKDVYPSCTTNPTIVDLAQVRALTSPSSEDDEGDWAVEIDWHVTASQGDGDFGLMVTFDKQKDRDKCFADMNLQIFAGKRVEYIP